MEYNMTFKEIADALQLSEEEVRNIYASAAKKLAARKKTTAFIFFWDAVVNTPPTRSGVEYANRLLDEDSFITNVEFTGDGYE